MNFKYTSATIKTDLFRYAGNADWSSFSRKYVTEPGFRYIVWLRLCGYLKTHRDWRRPLYYLSRLVWRHYCYKFGIEIGPSTQIGTGFYIGHFGGIIVNQHARIGKNCNISQGVTIGVSNKGSLAGCPVIGDNVFIGPGAKIFGKIEIGDNVAIGANAVVTRDVPRNTAAVGIPARTIENSNSDGYINNTEYSHLLTDEHRQPPI